MKRTSPTNATRDHSVRFEGHFERNAIARMTKVMDATMNRREAARNGGAPCNPMRIASHVEPQITQSIAKAAPRANRVAIAAGIVTAA